MTDLFRTVLNMSVTGAIAVLVVVLLRLPLRHAPRWIRCALWAVVFVRLLVPFSFSSSLSLLGSVGAPEPVNGVVAYLPSDSAEMVNGVADRTTSVTQVFPTAESATESANSIAPTPLASADPMQIWLAIGTAVWLVGIAGLVIYAIAQYIRLHKRVRDAVRVELDVFETDAVTSPFVMGILRPCIILPVGMPTRERELVLLHERAHIFRLDHVAKPLAFLILAVHWFNPFVWLAFKLFCEDMEASCDERAITALDREEIASYGETLLRLGTRRAAFAGGPLAFGEHCTKGRIVNVLNYKKRAFWIVVLALAAAIITGIVLLANPLVKPKQAVEPTVKELELVDMQPSAFDQQTYDLSETGGYGAGGYVSPQVDFYVDLSLLGDKSVSAETVVNFANLLANGQNYIQTYLKKNAEGCYDFKMASSKVEYSIMNDDWYSYYMRSSPPMIRIGKMYWHCSQYYVFMILHPETLHWQHFGYAEYLGSVLNPYDMWLAKLNREGIALPMGSYVMAYFDKGGSKDKLTNDDYRLLVDSIAFYCIQNGMNWGTAYESYPITKIYGFTEPAEQGDDMSVEMASSFCAYLAEHYGFDRLTSYCSGQMDFHEAFGISFDRAYAKWQKTILKEFS